MTEVTGLWPSNLQVLVVDDGQGANSEITCLDEDPILRQARDTLLAHCREESLPVTYLGTSPLFSGHRVYCGHDSDWALFNLCDDPLFHDRDGFPVPSSVLQTLRRIENAGVDFDALFVAHEVKSGAIREGEAPRLESLLPPPPGSMTRLSDQLGKVSDALWAVATAPLALGATLGAASAIAVAGAGLMTLDPILFGAVVATGRSVAPGEMAGWFYLARWTYGEEA